MPKRERSEGSSIHLRCLGFCGADDSVEPALLAAVSAQHEWVEWGVLFRPDKEGLPRYASPEWLKRLGEANRGRSLRLAAHLCSSRVDELLKGDLAFVSYIHKEIGFDRVQINATAANNCDVSVFATDAGADACVERLRKVFAALPDVEFIVQRNAHTKPLWSRLAGGDGAGLPPNMSLLYDDSMGLGKCSASWPAPPEAHELKFGYAGGLSPANLAQQLRAIDAVAGGRTLWVDMESSLRTALKDGGDIFDVNKAMKCVDAVIEHGYAPASGA